MDQMGTDLAEGMSESTERNAKGNRLVLAVKEQSEIQGLQAADIPYHLWENILARLPISNLFRMLSVCTAWNSMVQSDSFLMAYKRVPPQDLFFILFAENCNRNVVAAYNPIDDKWVVIPMSYMSSSCPCSVTCSRLRKPIVSGGGLLVAENRKGSLVVCNLFTKTHRILPPMFPMKSPYVVAMVVYPERNSEYEILVVSTVDGISSQVYDSRSDSWKICGSFDGRFAMLGNAAHLDGFLFCLTHGPDHLLAFDVDAGTWDLVEVTMPPVVCPHILEHEGSLILVGGIEELGVLKKISIWELDESVKQWQKVCSMPDHLFSKFSHGNLNHFFTVGLWGKICFYRNYSPVIFMYDLLENRWWGLPHCPLYSRLCKPSWFCLALEPRLDAMV